MKASQNKYIYLLVLCAVLSSTYFLNNNRTHDWGDDFAQYLYQAKHIKNDSLPYKQVLNINELGSNKRSPLFSEILSLIPTSSEIKPYLDIIFLFFILSAIAVFLFFCKHFHPFISLLITLGVYLNYHVIQLKEEVMCEFVFMFFLYVVFIIAEKSKTRATTILIPILFGLAAATRSVGIIFFIAYLIHLFISKDRTIKIKFIETGISILLFSLTLLLINALILPEVKNSEVSFYTTVFDDSTFHTIIDNIHKYILNFQLLFEQEIWKFTNVLIIITLSLLFSTGFFVSVRKNFGFKEIAFILYLLFLLFYPYGAACLRFLIPILPLLLFYVIMGLLCLLSIKAIPKTMTLSITSAYLCLLILSNVKTVWINFHQEKNQYGPYRNDIVEDFQKIAEKTKSSESIAFCKPFIINLFCERNSYYYSEKNFESVKSQADYVLIVKNEKLEDIYDPVLKNKVPGIDTLELTNFLLIRTK